MEYLMESDGDSWVNKVIRGGAAEEGAVKIHSEKLALPLGINEATEWHCVPASMVNFRV